MIKSSQNPEQGQPCVSSGFFNHTNCKDLTQDQLRTLLVKQQIQPQNCLMKQQSFYQYEAFSRYSIIGETNQHILQLWQKHQRKAERDKLRYKKPNEQFKQQNLNYSYNSSIQDSSSYQMVYQNQPIKQNETETKNNYTNTENITTGYLTLDTQGFISFSLDAKQEEDINNLIDIQMSIEEPDYEQQVYSEYEKIQTESLLLEEVNSIFQDARQVFIKKGGNMWFSYVYFLNPTIDQLQKYILISDLTSRTCNKYFSIKVYICELKIIRFRISMRSIKNNQISSEDLEQLCWSYLSIYHHTDPIQQNYRLFYGLTQIQIFTFWLIRSYALEAMLFRIQCVEPQDYSRRRNSQRLWTFTSDMQIFKFNHFIKTEFLECKNWIYQSIKSDYRFVAHNQIDWIEPEKDWNFQHHKALEVVRYELNLPLNLKTWHKSLLKFYNKFLNRQRIKLHNRQANYENGKKPLIIMSEQYQGAQFNFKNMVKFNQIKVYQANDEQFDYGKCVNKLNGQQNYQQNCRYNYSSCDKMLTIYLYFQSLQLAFIIYAAISLQFLINQIQMTTNNISQKEILAYVVSTFQYWGIHYLTENDLKAARTDKPQPLNSIKKLLFHLFFLHMFNFQFTIQSSFNQKKQIKQTQLNQMILAYLSQCECPYLTDMQSEQGQIFVGCNLQSSRNMLLLCGWVMAISDYFNKIQQKVIKKRSTQIQNPRKNIPTGSKNILSKTSMINILNPEKQTQKITRLYKSIKARQYNAQCLLKKKEKIILKMQKRLKQINPKLQIQYLINSKDVDNLVIKKQSELKAILDNQIQNMKQRKYFWVWLQEKVIKEQKQQLKNNQNFEPKQFDYNITYGLQVDLDYLFKYQELCQYYQDKVEEMVQKLNYEKFVFKKSKQIQAEVNQQFKQILFEQKNKNNKKHLFLALQLKNYMNLKVNKQKQKQEAKKTSKINNQKSVQQKSLAKQLKCYLAEIQNFIMFR